MFWAWGMSVSPSLFEGVNIVKLLSVFILAAAACGSTSAMAQSFDFSTPVVTSPTAAPGVWYTDRYAPAGFQTSGGKLIETINTRDQQSSAFLNTQGRAYDLNSGTKNLSIDLTIGQTWASENKRWAGLWGVGTAIDGDHNPANITAYPILEFTNDGGVARFRGYDSNVGTWQDLIPAGGITYGNTYTLGIGLSGNTFTYSVGGATASFTADDPTASIASVILQGYNTQTTLRSYDIVWDNLNATGAVPEPATWAMMIGGFGLLGGAMRRRGTTAVSFA